MTVQYPIEIPKEDTMETDVLIQLVSNVGFPIAAFAAMYYMCNTTIKDVKTGIDNLTRSIDLLIDREKKEDKDA